MLIRLSRERCQGWGEVWSEPEEIGGPVWCKEPLNSKTGLAIRDQHRCLNCELSKFPLLKHDWWDVVTQGSTYTSLSHEESKTLRGPKSSKSRRPGVLEVDVDCRKNSSILWMASSCPLRVHGVWGPEDRACSQPGGAGGGSLYALCHTLFIEDGLEKQTKRESSPQLKEKRNLPFSVLCSLVGAKSAPPVGPLLGVCSLNSTWIVWKTEVAPKGQCLPEGCPDCSAGLVPSCHMFSQYSDCAETTP